MHVDRTAGLVQVTDFTDRLDQVGVYVEAVQLRAARQVRIDAHVFEVALADGGAASIDWRAPAIRSATVTRGVTTAGVSSVAVTDIDALKKAIAQQGTISAIASPQVVAMNNEPAIMRFGSATVNADSSARQPIEGLTLAVVAQISADGIVQMHLAPSYTSRTTRSPTAALRTNETDTLVRVQDGETVVLSGFLSEREGAGPGSSANDNQVTRSELVILLTPIILRAAGSPH
jgi:type II secretory pathway component GspD/PulD (secretin)